MDEEELISSQSAPLLCLPDDLLHSLMVCIGDSKKDLACVSSTCKRLWLAATSDSVWQQLCSSRYPQTIAKGWISASLACLGSDVSVQHYRCSQPEKTPCSYRSLYRLLEQQQQLVGYWRGVGDAPRGSLFKVTWGHDCLELHQLQCLENSQSVKRCLLLKLGPGYPLQTADVVGNDHLVVHQYRGEKRQPCAAAAAAASVSAGGSLTPAHRHKSSPGIPVRTQSWASLHHTGQPALKHSNGAELASLHSPSRPATSIISMSQSLPSLPLAGGNRHPSSSPSHMKGASSRSSSHTTLSNPSPSHLSPVGHNGGAPTAGHNTLAAAAIVATTPTIAFEAEVLKYMTSQVAPPRGAARRQQKAAARAASLTTARLLQEQQQQQQPVLNTTDTSHTQGVPASSTASSSHVISSPSRHIPNSSSSHQPADVTTEASGTGTAGISRSSSDHDVTLIPHGSSPAREGGLLATPVSNTRTHRRTTSNASNSSSRSQQQMEPQDATDTMQAMHNSLVAQPYHTHTRQPTVSAGGSAQVLQSLSSKFNTHSLPLPHCQPRILPVGPPVHTHHFKRLAVPQVTRAHPHAGLWAGVYGPHGPEILSVSYDFSGLQAVICACKLTGDHNVPAGQDSWWAAAAPQPLPWPDTELRLQEARAWLSDSADPDQVNDFGVPASDESAVGSSNTGEIAKQLPKVIASHVGRGRVAGHNYSNPQWVPGRLWVYEGGDIAFLFMLPGETDEPMFLVEYARVT